METKNYINEVWKPIKGYVGFYEVSNFGRVRSVDRLVTHKDGRKCQYKGLIRAQRNGGLGYKTVTLIKNSIKKTYLIHRLVAFAFPEICGEWFVGAVVNHKDENPSNNHAENLELVTQKYNVNYGTGLKRQALAQAKPVLQHTLEWEFIKRWDGGQSEAARELNLIQTDIGECCRGKRKSHGGFCWTFA